MSDPTPQKPARTRKGCLARLVAIGIGLALALLAAEALVRLFTDELLPHPNGPRYSFVHDDVIGLRLNPGFEGHWSLYDEFDVPVRISSKGCRDREFGPKEPGTVRILCLGDSYCFGYGVRVEDAYPKVLEKLLADDAKRVEVLNAGASSYGTLHMIEVLKRTREWFEPDIVLASFFFANDLYDIAKFPEQDVRGGIVLSRHFADTVDRSAWLRFCFEWSDLALLIERARFNASSPQKLGEVPRPEDGAPGLALLRKPEDTPSSATRWRPFEEALADLKRETEKAGAKLVLFSIPQEYQTRTARWDQLRAEGKIPGDVGAYDLDLVGRTVGAICAKERVAFLDLVPGFRARRPESSRFFPVNRHFNESGHALAAELIAAFLRSQGTIR